MKFLTALLVCFGFLCMPLVSYGSDEAKTAKSEYEMSYDIDYDSPSADMVSYTFINDVGDYTYKDRNTLFEDVKDFNDTYKYIALAGKPLSIELIKHGGTETRHSYHYLETYKSKDYSIPYRKTSISHPKIE